ncbi:recombinase family protein [Paenibacillus bouchesdurhonensis]|uniref:recombinase family protein n=1 Tax=Paenibacillus bouchesdurhonensis TaxID=1870990 RepID=UPI0019016306|nr:recombinase family protein [Paenibacillus bouchesdurhonensis]
MMKKDRGYVRVSTLYDSQKDSPEHQESFLIESAAREGVELDRIYEDRDTGTSIVAREDVQKMIADAKSGEIRSLWFTSLSRFSRDALDAISLKRILVNALNIRVVSIEDGYDSAKKDDELLFGIKAVVNQNTSGDISVSSRRGIRKSVLEDGNIIASKPAYGYKIVTTAEGRRTYETYPEQAAVVDLIYELYISGTGDKNIVNYLNGENPAGIVYKSYTGRPWNLGSVQSILKNPTYTGYNISGRYTTEVVYDDLNDLMNRRKKLVQRPESEWEWSKEQTHPAIIPLERYKLARELRIQRGGAARGGRRTFVNVFAKMIFCKDCGSAMVTMKGKSRDGGKEYRYLLCSRRRRMGKAGCSNNTYFPYYDLRNDLIGNILGRIRQKIRELESRGTDDIGITIPQNDFDKEKRKLNKQIENNRKLLFEIRRQHMLGDIQTSQYEYEKEQYEKEITDHEKRLEAIVAEEKRSFDVERIKKDARRVLTEMTNLKSYDDDIQKTRALLMQVVRRIDVAQDGDIDIRTYI